MSEQGLPKTRAEADQLIVEHLDWKVSLWWGTSALLGENSRSNVTLNSLFFQTEIDARAERMDSVRDFGLGLIRSGHSSKAEIQKALNQLQDAKAGLDRAWLNRNTILEQARTLKVMIQD